MAAPRAATELAVPVPSTAGMSITDSQTSNITDQDALSARFPHGVLLAPPTSRTIPLTALRAEAGLSSNEVWSISAKEETDTLDNRITADCRQESSETISLSPPGTGRGSELHPRPSGSPSRLRQSDRFTRLLSACDGGKRYSTDWLAPRLSFT